MNRYILKNGENIIQFVGDLLKINVDSREEQNEMVCICLTFLTLVLYEMRKKKRVNWDVFTALLGTIEKYKQSSAVDVKLLADEVSFFCYVSRLWFSKFFSLSKGSRESIVRGGTEK